MGKYVGSIRDVPEGTHWVILTDNSHYTPADERSKTHPGHGYPASTDYYMDYHAYTDREEWEKEVERMTRNSEKFKAFSVVPAKIVTEVKVTIG